MRFYPRIAKRTTMKKHYVFFLLIFPLIACDDDDDGSSSQNPPMSAAQLESVMENDTWIVTEFIDDDDDDTFYFTGYEFTFETDGDLIAFNASDTSTVSGTWFTLIDDGQTELWIDFSSIPRFSELNEDWYLIAQTTNEMRFRDDDDGDDDFLTFQRVN
jgi:hypothetical protein